MIFIAWQKIFYHSFSLSFWNIKNYFKFNTNHHICSINSETFFYYCINCLINKLPLKQQFMINPLLWKRKHFNRCTLFKYVIEVAEKQDQALRTSFLRFMTAWWLFDNLFFNMMAAVPVVYLEIFYKNIELSIKSIWMKW